MSKGQIPLWDMLKNNAVKIIDGHVGTNVTPSVKINSRTGKYIKWLVYILAAMTILFIICVQIAEWILFIPWDSYMTGGIFSTEYMEKSIEKARKYPELYKTVMITKYSVYSIYITVFILSALFTIIKNKTSLSKQQLISLLWRSGKKT